MRVLVPIAASLTLAGPVHGAEPAPGDTAALLASTPNQLLTFTVGDKVQIADVTRDGIREDDMSLHRSPGRLRGHLGRDALDLELEPGRVAGTFGTRPVGLDVVRSASRLDVAGSFGRQSVAMEIRRENIEAQIGACAYHLPFARGHYHGFVDCGGRAVTVDLTVPVALIERDDRELAAMLTVLLAR